MSDPNADLGPAWSGDDEQIHDLLSLLDPERRDPNYWMRFRSWVVDAAGQELARRRVMVDITVGQVLTAWSRTLVPTALAAAAAAAFVLVRPPAASVTPITVDELLVAELDAPIPDDAEPTSVVAFAAEHF